MGVSMNGDKPELKQWSFDLNKRSPVENSGMRHYDLNIGGVHIATFLGKIQDRFVR